MVNSLLLLLLSCSDVHEDTNNTQRHALVSGLWNLAYAVGNIIGPSVGGLIVSVCGFPLACSLFAYTSLFLVSSLNGLKLLHYSRTAIALFRVLLENNNNLFLFICYHKCYSSALFRGQKTRNSSCVGSNRIHVLYMICANSLYQ